VRYRPCRTETQDRIFLLYSIYKVSLVSPCPSFQSTVKQAGSNERPQSRTKEVANEGPFAPRIIRWRTTRPPRCRKPFDKSSSKTCQESQLGRTALRFGTHLAQTNKLVERLKQVMVSLGEKPSRKKCSAGIIQERNDSRVKRSRQLLWTPPCLPPRKGQSTMKLPPMVAFKMGQRTAQDDDAELLAKTLK
jgi:hypothetical protein